MSTSLLIQENPALDSAVPPVPMPDEIPSGVARKLLSGTSALSLGLLIERGSSFAANIVAARLAGATAFGAYAIAISTANNISTYAAGGIGSTAARFSGKYPFSSGNYAALARALLIIAFASAFFAAAVLWLGARPLAAILHQPALKGLLQWAAVSAAGIILLECARGFFVGQRKLAALLLLSILVGAGVLALVPLAAHARSPLRMVLSQGSVSIAAVFVCLLLAGWLGLRPAKPAGSVVSSVPILREVWSFGMVQLAGLVSANLAGWWLTATVARRDTTLVQMSFFTIASQLRNITSLPPSLLTEGSYAVMADPEGEGRRTPQRVMAICVFASTAATLLLAGLGMLVLPWAVPGVYGRGYSGAVLGAAAAMAVAVVHMGNAPAAARLSIVSIRAAGLINTGWAVIVAISATLLMISGSSNAATAMAVFFLAHLASAAAVLIILGRKDGLPKGTGKLYCLGTATIAIELALAFWRVHAPRYAAFAFMATLVVFLSSTVLLFRFGKKYGWLPTSATLAKSRRAALERVRRFWSFSSPGRAQ